MMRHIRIDDDAVVCKLRGGQQCAAIANASHSAVRGGRTFVRQEDEPQVLSVRQEIGVCFRVKPDRT